VTLSIKLARSIDEVERFEKLVVTLSIKLARVCIKLKVVFPTLIGKMSLSLPNDGKLKQFKLEQTISASFSPSADKTEAAILADFRAKRQTMSNR
jgi:hypothetical protein